MSDDALFRAFTGGVLSDRWSAGGVQTEYDPIGKNLTFALPEGWTDRVSPAARKHRAEEWCLEDPSFNVEYRLRLLSPNATEARDVKLTAVEHDDGTIEFRTAINFDPVRGIPRGASFLVDVKAYVALVKNKTRAVVMFQGEAVVPPKTMWLSENTPGFFFVVDAGFILSVHALPDPVVEGEVETVTIIHVSFIGRMSGLEKP
jgi:hypothetical protein